MFWGHTCLPHVSPGLSVVGHECDGSHFQREGRSELKAWRAKMQRRWSLTCLEIDHVCKT